MELFLGSFVIFLLSAAALMVGQLCGRSPIGGSCSSDDHCAHAVRCKLECTFRHRHPREGGER